MLTPVRRRGLEILDEQDVDAAVRDRAQRDIVRSNRWLGGERATMRALRDLVQSLPREATLLDVGTGLADLPERAAIVARAAGVTLMTIGVDRAPSLLHGARRRLACVVCADARALPFRDGSVDVVTCSQLLHHFELDDAERAARELTRVARRFVIVSDLRRSWVAAIGFVLASFALRFDPVTRHDGFVSVLRGFTPAELERLVERAVGVAPVVARRLGYRVTAYWTAHAND